jgi:hypothetical protein
MKRIDRRPILGSGCCARCASSLTLASLEVNGKWYCSTPCADGRLEAGPRRFRVPEARLYARPLRFFQKRRAKELRAGPPQSESKTSK